MSTALGRFKPFRFMKSVCKDSFAKTLCVFFFFTIIMSFAGFKSPEIFSGFMFAMSAFMFTALKYPQMVLWKKMFVEK